MKRLLWVLLLGSSSAFAADDFTVYDLLAPDTHSFAITYDTTQKTEGAEFFMNPVRAGAVSTKERVIERATGKELQFEEVTGKDNARFIKVHLPGPVPKGGETRIPSTRRTPMRRRTSSRTGSSCSTVRWASSATSSFCRRDGS